MAHPHSNFFLIIAVGTGLFFILGISWQWSRTVSGQEGLFAASAALQPLSQSPAIRLRRKQKPEQRTVKALYLTAYSAGTPAKIDAIIDFINRIFISGNISYNFTLLYYILL